MSNYFSVVPDFEYVSRLPDANISDYINVKNFFKRITLKQDIYQDLSFFTKYKIKGDDRPDNVAFQEYGRSDLDWIVLTSNNILNIQSEWPMPQFEFDKYLIEKYGTYDNLNNTHHHETTELKNNDDVIIVQKGLRVESNYSITYYENSGMVTQSPVVEVTNYQYEEQLNDSKRNIFLLKDIYLNVIIDDFQDLMTYKKGSSQYKTETLKTADNIRLF
jgi:hypothetical protein|tara:strand:- start:324 stop:977 length:654 start_codon:yes stop_codon:yes gene_type:complete